MTVGPRVTNSHLLLAVLILRHIFSLFSLSSGLLNCLFTWTIFHVLWFVLGKGCFSCWMSFSMVLAFSVCVWTGMSLNWLAKVACVFKKWPSLVTKLWPNHSLEITGKIIRAWQKPGILSIQIYKKPNLTTLLVLLYYVRFPTLHVMESGSSLLQPALQPNTGAGIASQSWVPGIHLSLLQYLPLEPWKQAGGKAPLEII